MRRTLSIAAVALVLTMGACGGGQGVWPPSVDTGNVTYVPIDSSIFVSPSTVAAWVSAHNAAAVSAHALAIWNGLTPLTGQHFRGTQLAVYDTWDTACNVFGATPGCGHGVIHQPTSIIALAPAAQFMRFSRIDATDILSDVRYNQEMTDFVDAGYDGLSYTSGAGQARAMADAMTNLPDTASPHAMMLKPAYELFSASQPTVVTYWAGPGLNVEPGSSTSPLVPDASTWLKVAVIDPTGKATNATPVTFCANTIDATGNIVSSANYTAPAGSYPVIPLSDFHALPVTSSEVTQIQANRAALREVQRARLARSGKLQAQAAGCPSVIPPDPVAALVAMHVVTAELHNVWTWQTFWWTPNATPLAVANPQFRHFDFATAYWTVDTQPTGWRYAFNPYLEAGFGTGVFGTAYWPAQGQPGSTMNLGETTNCISCHEQATYTVSAYPSPVPYYVAHDDQPQIATPQSILVRNLWSVADHAAHPPQ